MINITDWINGKLYPVLLTHRPELPELSLRESEDWISSNGRKKTGEQGKWEKLYMGPGTRSD